MFKSTFVRAVVSLISAGALCAGASAMGLRKDQTTPVVFSIEPAGLIVVAGQQVQLEIDLNQPAPVDETLVITTVNPLNWAKLPTQIVIPAGQSKAFFQAQTSPLGIGVLDASATLNGASISALAILVGSGS